MSNPYRIVHEEDFSEEASDQQYIVAKVYNTADEEIGQVKLVIDQTDNVQGVCICIIPSGDIEIAGGPTHLHIDD